MLAKLIYCICLLSAATSTLAIFVSVRETKKNTASWHFGLVIHGKTDIEDRKANEIYEVIIDNEWTSPTVGYMVYDGPRKDGNNVVKYPLKPSQAPFTFDLGATVKDSDILAAMMKFAPSFIPAKKEDGSFFNCFDFTKQTIDILREKDFISADDEVLKQFEKYYTETAREVRKKTDDSTRKAAEEARKNAEPGKEDSDKDEVKEEEVATKANEHTSTKDEL
ncbi:hypothetical protein FA15DRAFT_706301 [Coprinopsis marcescibilis]|uniref:Uncharacterized protein n=1 Tax=Coprinopsis marcescibilis TaxID=230819 RepID=A0A5C3KQ76_COPMA|nr:hypothetical protein FA15DRAFT_706301 [Coprinopsis marcescibilis]